MYHCHIHGIWSSYSFHLSFFLPLLCLCNIRCSWVWRDMVFFSRICNKFAVLMSFIQYVSTPYHIVVALLFGWHGQRPTQLMKLGCRFWAYGMYVTFEGQICFWHINDNNHGKLKLHFVAFFTDMCSNVRSICRLKKTYNGTFIFNLEGIFVHRHSVDSSELIWSIYTDIVV